MAVVGEWWRGAARAGVVALVLPVALVAGIALTAAIGGGDRLHALGQVVAGPSVPAAGARGAPDLVAAEHVPPTPLASALATAPRPGSAVRAPTRTTHRGTSPGRHPASTAPHRPSAPNGTTPAPSSSSPAPSGSGSGSSPPPPPPPDNPVRDAGEQVAATAGQVPVAGPVAAQAVQTVVDLVAPPPPPSPAAAPAVKLP